MEYIDKLREKGNDIRHVAVLDEDMVWQEHEPLIWQADHFEGTPSFYNVYRYNNYYSYSLLALILLKGRILVNQHAVDKTSENNFSNYDGNYTIDLEVEKIGAPHACCFDITDPDEYCAHIAEAMVADMELIEARNPGKTNLVMCGGRDSINLLLLPWKNPLVALSAEPNYPLVCEFVRNNGLDIQVRKLEDPYDKEELQDEVVEACCRAGLSHWRWGVDLRKVAREYEHNAIIWKGQLGDVYLNENWKDFITPYVEPQRTVRRTYKKISHLLPQFIHRAVGHRFQPIVIKRIWEVCSNLQGGHMCFIRALTDMLVLSGYHGPNMSALISKVDLGEVCQNDLRPAIGKILAGHDVYYPNVNPWPKISSFRKELHKPEHFIDLLEAAGVDIIYPVTG